MLITIATENTEEAQIMLAAVRAHRGELGSDIAVHVRVSPHRGFVPDPALNPQLAPAYDGPVEQAAEPKAARRPSRVTPTAAPPAEQAALRDAVDRAGWVHVATEEKPAAALPVEPIVPYDPPPTPASAPVAPPAPPASEPVAEQAQAEPGWTVDHVKSRTLEFIRSPKGGPQRLVPILKEFGIDAARNCPPDKYHLLYARLSEVLEA